MAREGATVIAVDNHQGRLDEAVPALRREGGRVEGRMADALDQAQVDALVAEVVENTAGSTSWSMPSAAAR